MVKKIKKEAPPKFNDQQQQVIDHNTGACLVVAVAGAGKTTAVVHRAVRLLKEGYVRPDEILITTFTKKAATEMNERLEKLGIDINQMQVSTFHSICLKILKEEILNFPEIDAAGTKAEGLIKYILGYQNMDWQVPPIEVLSFISNCKNALLRPKDIDTSKMMDGLKFKQAYELFEKMKKAKKFITFDDLLIDTWELFEKKPEVLRKWQKRFKYVVVDEFQDTNTAQYEIMRMVSLPENNLMVVGDDDQSVYSWRGAIPEYMIDFANAFNAITIKMEKNYRCPTFVERIANPMISLNEKRLSKHLEAARGTEGTIDVFESFDFDDEAIRITEWIEGLPEFQNKQLNEIAILYRTNAQSRAMEDIFISKNIPYEMVGGSNFYERKEIKDLIAYVTAAFDIDHMGDTAFERIINIPFRYLGRQFLSDLGDYRKKMKMSFEEALRDMPMGRNQENQVNGLLKVISGLKSKQDLNPSFLLTYLVEAIDYENYIKKFEGEGDIESSRMGNVREFIRASGKFKTIQDYMKHIEKLKTKRNKKKTPNKNKVILSTIHRAKGLEWNNVIMIGCNEQILPHGNAILEPDGLEEERRLAYVAVTRPKARLAVSYVQTASVSGGIKDLAPSRFLSEMKIL
jgi:DNA helicase II / ATP-dependent DNA helicase PcrA